MASLPQVGLEAVIAGLPGFNAGAKAIISAYENIERKASNVERATQVMGKGFSSITGPIGALSSQFVGLGQNVLKFGAIAGGAALVGVTALTAGVVALGASALQEAAKYERMSLSINNLVAREISQGQVVEQQRQVLANLTKKEAEELENLQSGLDNEINSRDVLSAQIQEQKERIRQLTEQYGEQGLVVIKERAELKGMELNFSDLNKEISDHQAKIGDLTSKQGQLVTVIDKVRVGQMSMSDALKEAAPRAQELLKWIQVLAIQSPFNQEDIANAFRTSLAYGFTTEQAQRLTSAMVDFTSATGKTGESAQLIALALGQIQARGKLSAQELRQLSEQGVGTNAILERMGFSLDDVTNGLVPVDAFMEAVIQDMEIFKGAAKEQSNTFAGLIASMEDLKGIALREFFTGTFNAIRPYVADFVGWLTEASVQTGAIKKVGESLGRYVGGALKDISVFIAAIRAGGLTLFSKYLGAEGIPLWYELKELIANITTSLAGFGTIFSDNLGTPLTDFTTNIVPLITQSLTFINDHFEEFKGALTGIGAVLGVGVFAAIVAGILSLLTPINLIIAGAAVLGAAWAGNWFGIRDTLLEVWASIEPTFMMLKERADFVIFAFEQFGASQGFAILGQQIVAVINMMIPGFTDVVTWLQVNIPLAIQFLSDTWTTILWPALQTVGIFISTNVIPTLMDFWTWIQDNLPIATQYLADLWTNTLQPAFSGVWSFVQTSLMPLVVSFTMFLNAVAFKAVQAMAGLWQNVLLPALTEVWEFIQQNVFPIFVSVAGVIKEQLGPELSNLTDSVFPPFNEALEYIKNLLSDLTGMFKGWTDAVMDFQLPDVLTPGSPTPLEIALLGIAQALSSATDNMEGLNQALQSGNFDKLLGIDRAIVEPLKVAGAAFDDLEKHLERFLSKSKASFALRKIKDVIKPNINAIMQAANPKKLIDELVKGAVGSWEAAGISNLTGVGSAFWTSFQKTMAERKELLQQMFIDAGKVAVNIGGNLVGVIGGAVDMLNARIERLQQIVAAGGGEFEGAVLSAVDAQLLLNAALQDQADIQDDILKTKEQEQQLSFLQKQLDLFQTIKDAGLSVSDVLGGLNLGLGANIPDLIEATNRVIQAMIAQVNRDLQLGTGLQHGGSFVVPPGFPNDTFPLRVSSGERIIVIPQGQASSNVGGNSQVNNYNFSMNVQTGANPQSVVRQYQTMRAMVS